MMGTLIRYPDNVVLAEIIKLGFDFIALSQYSHIAYDYHAVIKSLVHFCSHRDEFYVAAIVDDTNTVIAYLIGKRTPYWFANNYYVASDLIIYVSPKYRGAKLSKSLINDFTDWAKSFGCITDIILGSTASHHPERAAKFYQHVGFQPFGLVCRKVGV